VVRAGTTLTRLAPVSYPSLSRWAICAAS
jgi:hypothetical protein